MWPEAARVRAVHSRTEKKRAAEVLTILAQTMLPTAWNIFCRQPTQDVLLGKQSRDSCAL